MAQELYNKYRPISLSEVVGQRHIVKLLRNRIDSDRISGAYLLVGPSGCGKTSIAYALQGDLDVHEMCYYEILSQNCTTEDVREMRSQMELVPWDPESYRIWLVDEAHTLSQAARCVFLSMLERLPNKCIVLFTTTMRKSFDRVWESRCRCMYFNAPSKTTITALLSKVAKAENAEHVHVRKIAKETVDHHGSNLRTALQLLEDEILSPGSLRQMWKSAGTGVIERMELQGLDEMS